MAEDFNDFGSYRRYLEDEEFKRRPLIRKIFSWRGFKVLMKILGYGILITMALTIIIRSCTSTPTEDVVRMLWTEENFAAYNESGGKLSVYTQNIGKPLDEDGKFAVYEFRYIPEIKEVQFTIRYNHSTVEKLADDISKQKKKDMEALGLEFAESDVVTEEMLSERPFRFAVKDDRGNVYDDYEYTITTKNIYTYIRISFTGIDLLYSESATPSLTFPTPSVNKPAYIYKGRFEAVETVSPVKYLFLESYADEYGYFAKESFSKTLAFYRAERGLAVYDYSDEIPSAVSANILSSKED